MTDADLIRQTLRNSGSMSRDELSTETGIPRTALAKALYALRRQGEVEFSGEEVVWLGGNEKTPMDATEAMQDAVALPQPPTEQENAAPKGKGTEDVLAGLCVAPAATDSVEINQEAADAVKNNHVPIMPVTEAMRAAFETLLQRFDEYDDLKVENIILQAEVRRLNGILAKVREVLE